VDGTGFFPFYNFSGADGNSPEGDLICVNGVLYGTTYRGGSTGQGTVFSLVPPSLPAIAADNTLGVTTNCFGFTITGPSNQVVIIDVSTNLGINWQPFLTNKLGTNCYYFADTCWTNWATRFYRLRQP
jgi:uncharacterized repeat protein (TIGR03803 family)